MTSLNSDNVYDYNHNYMITLDGRAMKLSKLHNNPIIYQRYEFGKPVYTDFDSVYDYIADSSSY
jgi:hypothetical protein